MIAVVGAGIMGLATAWALAKRGVDVLLLEQFEVGHRHGSSHGSSRIFRLSYPDAKWIALAQEAEPLWRQLERETGTELLTLNGLLDAVRDLDAYTEALGARGVPYSLVAGGEAASRFGVAYEPEVSLLYQPDAGIARADRALAALRDAVVARGGRVREGARVEALEPAGGGVGVRGAGEARADAVVVTAGGWVQRLAEPLGIDVPVSVSRETVTYFATDDGWTPPSVIDDLDDHAPGQSFYALAAPGAGLKVGVHHSGPAVSPDDDGVPDPATVAASTDWVRRRMPRAVPEPTRSETCLYTNAPDDAFLLERHGRVVVGSPCSGHGFKFAPAVGERLADLALEAAADP